MAETKEQLSPEEKLLRVIQGDGKTADEQGNQPNAAAASPAPPRPAEVASPQAAPASPGAAPAIADAPAEVKPPVAPPKARLKRARRDTGRATAPAAAAPVVAAASAAAAPATGKIDGSAAPKAVAPGVTKRSSQPREMGIRLANKCLAVAVVIVLLLMGFEIWANVRPSGATSVGDAGALPPVADPSAGHQLPELGEVLASFRQRPFFGTVVEQKRKTVITGRGEAHIRENVVLLGITWVSDAPDKQEAILSEKRKDAEKMHYLKIGDTFTAADEVFTLSEIHSDRIVFADAAGNEMVLQ